MASHKSLPTVNIISQHQDDNIIKNFCMLSIAMATCVVVGSSTFAEAQPIVAKQDPFLIVSGTLEQITSVKGSRRFACFIDDVETGSKELLLLKTERGKKQYGTMVDVPATLKKFKVLLSANKSQKAKRGIKRRALSPKTIKTLSSLVTEISRSARACGVSLKPKPPPVAPDNNSIFIPGGNPLPDSQKTPTSQPPRRPGGNATPQKTPQAKPSASPTSTPLPIPVLPPESVGATVEERITRGLKAWRAPDKKFPRVNCASCHAPDAYDLAMLNYSDQALIRRASPHVSPENSALILDLIKAQREKYKITSPPDPFTFRPFQPTGDVFDGDTTYERDFKFGESLASKYKLRLIDPTPIKNLQEAKRARDEVLTLDLRTLKIGIPFNKWTEDSFRGPEHSTTADWLTDLPLVPIAGKESTITALQDSYISDPSDTNFWKLYEGVANLTEPLAPNTIGFERINTTKTLSVLIAQHLFRKTQMSSGSIDNPMAALSQFAPREIEKSIKLTGQEKNPFWEIGDATRVLFEGKICSATVTERCLAISQDLYDQLSRAHSFRDQFALLRLPWFWIGWMFDQGLNQGHQSNSTRTGEYFVAHLLFDPVQLHPVKNTSRGDLVTSQGFPMHRAFFASKKKIMESFVPGATGNQSQRMIPSFAYYPAYGRDELSVTEPRKRNRNDLAKLVSDYQANMYLMWIFLLEEELNKFKTLEGRQRDITTVRGFYTDTLDLFAEYFTFLGGEFKAAAEPAIARVRALATTLPASMP
jgi:hypothetical protein